MAEVSKWFLTYTIFSFFGYISEVIYVAICTKKITNRGYLYGPLVPIYGYGGLIIIASTSWAYNLHGWYSPFLVFILSFVLTSVLEYLTSLGMELIFHMRWWDYSDKFGNINGRVCLRNSTLFGIGGLAIMYLAEPYVASKVVDYIYSLGDVSFYIIVGTIFVAQVLDTVFSTIKHINVSKIIRKLDELAKAASAEIKEKATELKENVSETSAKLKNYLENSTIAKKLSRIQLQYPTLKIRSVGEKSRQKISELIDKIKEIL